MGASRNVGTAGPESGTNPRGNPDVQKHSVRLQNSASRTGFLNGLGSAATNTFYNCYVIGLEARTPELGQDSRSAITDMVGRMVEITARGGGVGVNWSVLRPADTYIRGVNSFSPGAVPWMLGADQMVNSIRQGGSRTAALMYTLDDWHPDLMEFVTTNFPAG